MISCLALQPVLETANTEADMLAILATLLKIRSRDIFLCQFKDCQLSQIVPVKFEKITNFNSIYFFLTQLLHKYLISVCTYRTGEK